MSRRDSAAASVRAALLTLAIACVSHSVLAAGPAPGAASSPPAAPAASTPAASAPTLYDIVVELGRSEAMGRQVAATLRESADWKALADKLADPTFAAELQVLEASSDKLTRARYMELVDADTQLRERVREVTDATAAIGSLARKIERDIEHLGSEAARWPQRAKLARELEAPEGIQRRTETAGPELAALRDRLRVRRDEILLAFERGVDLQSRIDALRARVAERRERIGTELRSVEGTPIWRSGPAVFPRDEVLADVRLARLETVGLPAPARRPARGAARRADRVHVRRPAPGARTRHAARRDRAAFPATRGRERAALRRGLPGRAHATGAARRLSRGRHRRAAARRHRRDADLRRADSRDRLDARVRRVRQRVSRRRGNEPVVRAAHARAAAAAVRRGARPRLAPRRARAVPALLAPVAGAPPRPAGAGHARRHRSSRACWAMRASRER